MIKVTKSSARASNRKVQTSFFHNHSLVKNLKSELVNTQQKSLRHKINCRWTIWFANLNQTPLKR